MLKSRYIIVVLVLFLQVSACASKNMKEIGSSDIVKYPMPEKALIYFIRNTSFGGFYHANLYDGMDYVGTLSAYSNIAYQAEPGKHMFMVESETADFMEADLAKGKTYYTYVVPTGMSRPKFSFRPQNGQIDQNIVDQDIKKTKQMTTNEAGIAWGEQNKQRTEVLMKKYLPEWGHMQILRPESGREKKP